MNHQWRRVAITAPMLCRHSSSTPPRLATEAGGATIACEVSARSAALSCHNLSALRKTALPRSFQPMSAHNAPAAQGNGGC